MAARQAAAFELTDTWSNEGARSAGHWIAFSTHQPVAKVMQHTRLGEALSDLPAVADAWLAGNITDSHVAAIARLRPINAEAMARDEDHLVWCATRENFNAFLRALKLWTYEVDPDFADGCTQRMRARRELFQRVAANGMLYGHYGLDSVSGEIFGSELARIEQQMFEADWAEANARRDAGEVDAMPARTNAQRRADALVEMAIRSRTAPPDGRRPEPLFSVFVGRESLHGALCRTASGVGLYPSDLMPWLDEAWLERIVFDGPSRVIDVGAQRRFFTGATRRAVELRDQECFSLFCDVPAHAAQVDHIQPYAAGGPTVVDNGRVACGKHNRDRQKRRRE